MLRKNETLPEIEQLNRHEFDLDIEEQMRLQAEADQEVERVMSLQVTQANCKLCRYFTSKRGNIFHWLHQSEKVVTVQIKRAF